MKIRNHHNLPKNSENKPRGLYFSKALFSIGLAYTWKEFTVFALFSKSIGLAYSWKESTVFCFVLLGI